MFTVSPNAVAQQPSKMGFKTGTQITVDNALKMLLVHSANDMAVVLAEGVSGSIENFADEMNAAPHRLGMTQTNYVNPNGLPADEQITSARDLAILARALIREFPEYDFYWHIAAHPVRQARHAQHNKLLDRYPGADGMKTGFICASGFNLVATATRDGKRLIAVVLGAPSSAARAVKAAQLFERGFSSDPLSWLMPSLGTVDSLVPVNAAPPNLRDDIAAGHRKRPAAEDEDETAAAQRRLISPDAFFLSSLRAPTPKGAALLGLPAAWRRSTSISDRRRSRRPRPSRLAPAAKKKPEATAAASRGRAARANAQPAEAVPRATSPPRKPSGDNRRPRKPSRRRPPQAGRPAPRPTAKPAPPRPRPSRHSQAAAEAERPARRARTEAQ